MMSHTAPAFGEGDNVARTGSAAGYLSLLFIGHADKDLVDAQAVIHNMARYEWGEGPVRVATATWTDIVEYQVKSGEIAVAYPAPGVATPGSAPPGVWVVRDRNLDDVVTAGTPLEVTQWLALPKGDDLGGLAAMFAGLDDDTSRRRPATRVSEQSVRRRWALAGAAVAAAFVVATLVFATT